MIPNQLNLDKASMNAHGHLSVMFMGAFFMSAVIKMADLQA